ncbi:MAG TPA: acyl-CoA carboxylase epsilon subunit [Nakamurella sp.]|nr:acyl-CoA carboxylase epsilon subunit [Nakamurella sp.]
MGTVAGSANGVPSEQSAQSDAELSQSRRDAEDVAAVVTVLAALAAHRASDPDRAGAERSFWGDPGRRMIVTAVPGPHAWWGSGLPR